jgi:hypothetical protein
MFLTMIFIVFKFRLNQLLRLYQRVAWELCEKTCVPQAFGNALINQHSIQSLNIHPLKIL